MQTQLSQYTAVIGIDWADKKHDVCVQDMATGKRRASQVRHRAEDLDEWARSLHRRFGGPIAVAVELSKGPIITVLQKYDFFVIFPVEPAGLASYRRTFALSGAKDDPTDAEFALKLLLSHAERFNNAAEVQKYGGVAPVTQRSGQSTWTHWRWQCPTFLRQTFVEWSAQTVNKSYWAGLYYHQQRAKGSSHQAAVRALAFKWIRILYRCWKTKTPYDETRYLKALQERGSPLLKTADAA